MNKVMFMGIHHIALIVSSENSVSFYQKLGFKETFRKQREYDSVVLLKDSTGLVLELFVDDRHSKSQEDTEPLGLRYLSFKVDSIEDAVKSIGVEISDINTDWFDKRYCTIFDPDGLPIELHE